MNLRFEIVLDWYFSFLSLLVYWLLVYFYVCACAKYLEASFNTEEDYIGIFVLVVFPSLFFGEQY